nr:unnamed protein product [Spirometra erinaceieuropaei]
MKVGGDCLCNFHARWKVFLLCWLLLLLGPTLQGRRSSPSLEVTGVTSTCMFLKWSDPPSESALQYFLLRGTALSSKKTVETRFGATEREGFLCNLEPYTNYATSLIPVTRVHGQPIKTDPENVLTLSSAPSPVNLTTVVSSGSHSVNMTWLPPDKPNGILEAYKAECYLPADNTPVASLRVDPQLLSVEVSGLAPNTLFECAVIAFTKGFPGGQGGGQTSSKRSPAVRTWQSNLVASVNHPAKVVTTDSNGEIDNDDSTKPHGTNTTVPLESNEQGFSEYASGNNTYVTNVSEEMTANSNDETNNHGSIETKEKETENSAVKLQDDFVGNQLMEPMEPAEQDPGSSAPGLSTTVDNAVDVKIIDSDEDTDERDSLGSNEDTTSAVIPTSHGNLDGDGTETTFESDENGSSVSVPAFNASGDNLTTTTIVYSNHNIDKLDPMGTDGNKSGSSTSNVHEYSTETFSTTPLELDKHGILREKAFQPTAIILTVVGIVSLLALATGFLQGIPHIPFISDVYGERVQTNRIFSGYLEPKSSHNAFVHMSTKEGYVKKEMAELQTQANVETLQEEGLQPVAIAGTTLGILCFLALVIGASFLVIRRRRRKGHILHVDLVEVDDANFKIHSDL